jgi:peptidoglycan/LPS O-acetylase OafA/YrhL
MSVASLERRRRRRAADRDPVPAAAPPATARGDRVFGLDLIRATAVASVLIAHASYLLEPVFAAPRTFEVLAVVGVELFFVLSGFLVGGIVIDTVRPDVRWLGNFWLRRWVRTLPNYVVFLVLNVVLFRAAYGRWPAFGAYLVFAQALAWPHPQFFTEAWSLAIEEVFYLLAPLVAMALLPLARSRTRVLGLLVATVVLLGAARAGWVVAADAAWDAGVRKVTLLRLDCIVYGVIAAYACRRWSLGPGVRRGLAVAGVAVAAYATWLLAIGWVRQSPLWRALFFSGISAGFAALLPIAASMRGAAAPSPLRRGTHRLALWSYSLYLTNLPVLRLIDVAGLTASTAAGSLALFVGVVVAAVAWAAASYRWFERPIMDARDGLAARLGLVDAAREAGPATAHATGTG